jgi:uncharacterized membrane-anchored protein YjiN (DUF445 family)
MTAPPAADDRLRAKRSRLRRMRVLATGLLLLMAAVLVASVAFEKRFPWLVWVEAFAEAAVIGAVADWFAVVALFRHPLGLPIPHTAIVPRNKDRIGAELGKFVEQNFLTPENIVAKLAEFDLVGQAVGWLAEPEHSREVAAVIRDFLPRLLAAFDDAEIERLIAGTVAARIEAIDLAKASGGILAIVTAGDRHQAVLDQILRRVGIWLHHNREVIKDKFSAHSSFTPRFVDAYIVNRFVDGIIDLISEVAVTPRHELRLSFDLYLHEFIDRLRFEPEFQARAEALKRDVLRGVALDEFVAAIWTEIKHQILADAAAESSVIEAQLVEALLRLAAQLQSERAVLDRLNVGLSSVFEAGLLRFRDQIALLIEEVVRRWNARDVTLKIELEVGSDLQFIRLNGTIVGGTVGLGLQAALMLLGLR